MIEEHASLPWSVLLKLCSQELLGLHEVPLRIVGLGSD